jgi:hypothetical protein
LEQGILGDCYCWELDHSTQGAVDGGTNHLQTLGDYYREPDNVPTYLNILGDYYGEPDNVYREATQGVEDGCPIQFALQDTDCNSSICLECLDDGPTVLHQDLLKSLETLQFDGVEKCCGSMLSGMDESAPQFFPDACDSYSHWPHSTSVVVEPVHAWEAPEGKSRGDAHAGIFSPHPPLPSTPCFRLEPTTLHVQGAAAGNLWSCLRHFFDVRMAASVTKANHEKHSIKANVVSNLTMYTVKVRIYAGNRGALVEMQRRLGDSVGFNRIFACLSQHVAEQLPSALVDPVVPVAGEVLSVAPHVAWHDTDKELWEVESKATVASAIDLAVDSSSPELRAGGC